MNPRDWSRLLQMFVALPGRPGDTARWLVENEWDEVCRISEWYADPGPAPDYAEAASQWKLVARHAKELRLALESLSFTARRYAGMKEHGFPDGKPRLWIEPLPEVLDTEEFAQLAYRELSSRKGHTWGTPEKEHETRTRRLLFAFLVRLINEKGKPKPKSHAQQIGAVIHVWATGDIKVLGSRFGERELKHLGPI